MSPNKKRNRQGRREKEKQQKPQNRLIMISLIVLGAALLVFVFIYPQLSSTDEIVVPEMHALPNVNGTVLGDPNAPATIDLFEDFQCIACKYFTESVEPLIVQYLVSTGKARLVFHNYPFIDGDGAFNGGQSDQAANAAMCASEQNRFWEMKAVIFANWNGENQGNSNDQALKAMAKTIELDTTAFNTCFDNNKYQDQIQADFEYGQELGIIGTPIVFVNGEQVGESDRVATFQEIAVAVDLIVNASE